ncbi:MAG: hypothetical protein WDN48_08345 [Pseudolabrys sp.]
MLDVAHPVEADHALGKRDQRGTALLVLDGEESSTSRRASFMRGSSALPAAAASVPGAAAGCARMPDGFRFDVIGTTLWPGLRGCLDMDDGPFLPRVQLTESRRAAKPHATTQR